MEQSLSPGRYVTGELETADATTAQEVTLRDKNGDTYTLQADEFLAIERLTLTTAVAADVKIFFDDDDDNAVDAGEVIEMGDFAANGGIVAEYGPAEMKRGQNGGKVHVLSDIAGDIKCTFVGFVRKTLTKAGPVGVPVHDPNTPIGV